MAKKEEKKKRKKSGISREPVTKDGGGATKEVIGGGGALSKEVLHENLSKEVVGGSCKEGLLSKNVEAKKSSRQAVRRTKTAGMKDKKSGKQSKEVIEPPAAVPGSNSSNQSEKGTSSAAKKEEKKEAADVHDTIGRALTINPWYHGMMPRDEIEELLKNDGDFLLRKTEVAHLPRYAISVTNMGRVRHILFVYRQHLWSLRGIKKPTLTELIETHVKDKIPVMADGTLIKVGVARPEFYILHEHVEVKDKLGGGSFGDVFKGVLKGKMIKKKQRCEFVREAKVMRRLNHLNIVKIYGVAPQEEPMLIVLELAAGGH
uniref:Tyrosine-protein kinase n=1 Tax=Ditylenchus dipsaci TaxID=166011 RepID=A0A915ENT4_9BILA